MSNIKKKFIWKINGFLNFLNSTIWKINILQFEKLLNISSIQIIS